MKSLKMAETMKKSMKWTINLKSFEMIKKIKIYGGYDYEL